MQKTFWTIPGWNPGKTEPGARQFLAGLVTRAAPFALLCASLAWCPGAAAQPVGIGVKVGATLTDAVSAVETTTVPSGTTLIVGPYLELRLGGGFSVEGDALYYPGLYDGAGGGSVWQFPILAKFSLLSGGPVQPYIEAGPAYSHLSDIKTLPDLLHSSNYGLVAGGGISFKIHAVRLSPEVRWNGDALTSISNPLGVFKSNRSQIVVLVGFGF